MWHKSFLGYPPNRIKSEISDRKNKRNVSLHAEPAECGSVAGAGKYDIGTTVSIKATPAQGSTFTKWSDEDTNAERQIVVNDDVDLTAFFEKSQCQLSLTAFPEGTGTVTGAGFYNIGATAQIKALPAQNYVFKNWSDGDTNAERNYVVTTDTSLTATFEHQTVNLTYDSGYDA